MSRNKGGRIFKFYCDHCYKATLDSNDEMVHESLKWTDQRDYVNHINSKKHCKLIRKNNEEKKHFCNVCEKYYDDIGWKLHQERNEKFWELRKTLRKKDWKCNIFLRDKKRYSCFDSFYYETEDPKLLKQYKDEEGLTEEEEEFIENEATLSDLSDSELDPEITNDVCGLCNKTEYYSYKTNSTILTSRDKDYIRYNLNITNYCNCVDESYKPKIIEC